MKRSGLIAMIALTLLPFVMTGLAVLFVLPDTIPLHAGAGGVDRVGSKVGAFEPTFIIVGCGALFTILYAFMDKLTARHGSYAHGGRIALMFALVWFNVLQLVFILLMATGV